MSSRSSVPSRLSAALPQSLRLAARRLAKSPGFTLLAGLVLAVGIGLNASVFSVVSAVLLRPLPVEQPDRLAHLYVYEENGPMSHSPLAFPDYVDLQDMQSFEGVLAHTLSAVALEAGAEPDVVFAGVVSGNFFSLLGVEPVLGRGFTEQEGAAGSASRVAVLSHGLWSERLGSDPDVLGRTVEINGRPFDVIGVAPRGFQGLMPGIASDLWVPIGLDPDMDFGSITNFGDATDGLERLQDRGQRWHFATARLRDGASMEQASAELEKTGRGLAAAYPATNDDREFTLLPASDVRLIPGVDGALFAGSSLLMGVVGLVLLIACANLANMLLARAAARRKEMATRLALGAGRGQLVRQLLAEGLLLSMLGGAAGLVLAAFSNRVISSIDTPFPLRIELGLSVDMRVLAFTLGATVLTTLLFALVPALQASRVDLASTLHDAARGSSGGVAARRLRNALVVAQVATSLVLVIGAALAVRSLGNAGEIDPGFEVEGVVTARLAPGLQGYEPERVQQLYEELQQRLEALPGVTSASDASHLPLTLNISSEPVADIDRAGQEVDTWPVADYASVSPGYFETLGVDLLAGRGFETRDDADARPVVVINETLAAELGGPQEALGQRVYVGNRDDVFEIVGVAAAGKYRSLGEPARHFFYRPLLQRPQGTRVVIMKTTTGDASASLETLRRTIRQLDPKLVIDASTLEQATASSLAMPRLGASLLGAFGGVGLLLAMLGLYGVIAYLVSQRTHEIGIRMAIGANRGEVLRTVLGNGLRLTAVGIGLGLLAAIASTRFLTGLLYGVSPTDPATLAAVSLFFLTIAAGAALGPAWRAARVDPVTALRHE